jgi:hypothetical protein
MLKGRKIGADSIEADSLVEGSLWHGDIRELTLSPIVQESNVRRLVVLYTRPRVSPGGQSRGILIKHISTGSLLRELWSTGSSSYETW